MTNASGWRFFILYHSLLIKINVNRIGLKINGIWCVLPQDVSITIEEQNPLFSDSGSYSYPIEMSVSQNRELFKSIDSPQGCIRPQDLDGLPFELWYDGNMLLYGITETDEDLEVDGDKCTINLVSGNGDFQSKIEGLQCTDVPLMDKIHVGNVYTDAEVVIGDSQRNQTYTIHLNENHLMEYTGVNISEPYPVKPYCNTRICVKETGDTDKMPYRVFDADRCWSGVCFYVAYFLECLFKHLGFVVSENHFTDVCDANRLAFFTTKCEFDYGDTTRVESFELDTNKKYIHLNIDMRGKNLRKSTFIKKEVLANNKNFPDVGVSDVLESLFNALGVKVVEDGRTGILSVYYLRDILRDNEVVDTPIRVRSGVLSYEKTLGIKLTYGGDEQNTAFYYDDWTGVRVVGDGPKKAYDEIVSNVSPYNKTCYINKVTGNKYRIKIDGEAEEEGNVKELRPSLFEVASFPDHVIGEDGEDFIQELKIGFTPLIENDVTQYYKTLYGADIPYQIVAQYVGVDMKKPASVLDEYEKAILKEDNRGNVEYINVSYHKIQNYEGTDDNPLRSHDSGFTLGVMRGAGNDAGLEVSIENYDGNGNSAWVSVAGDYAFTADSMDAYGNHYDYNGDLEGGVVGLEDTISLKTHIQTAKDVGLEGQDWGIDAQAAKRGLADRFMSEYMYFLLHRKTVSMDVDTTLSQLTSLSWFKQLRIDGTVGRLKSRTYTLSNEGVTDQGIELYTIN